MAETEKILDGNEPELPGFETEPQNGGWVGTPIASEAGIGDVASAQSRAGVGGRPKGAKNKRQDTLQRWLLARGYRHPAVHLAETYNTPVDVLAKVLGCKKVVAKQLQDRAAEALMPYFEGKIAPVTYDGDPVIPMLNINMGTNSLAEMGVQAADDGGWSMFASFQQNQSLSRAANPSPNAEPPNNIAEDVQYQEVDHHDTTD